MGDRTAVRLNIHFHNEQRKIWKCALRQLEITINIKMTNHLFVGKTVSEDKTMDKKNASIVRFLAWPFGILLNIFIWSRIRVPICLFPYENCNCLRKTESKIQLRTAMVIVEYRMHCVIIKILIACEKGQTIRLVTIYSIYS